MSALTFELAGDVTVILGQGLERERQLGGIYRQEMQTGWGGHVRKLWEEGWALKRAHQEVLRRLLGSIGNVPTEQVDAAPSPSSRREVLSWFYEQEGVLASSYRECVGLLSEPEMQRVIRRLADDQQRLLDRLRETYRDYSAA